MVPVVPPLKGNMAAQDLQKRYFGVLGLLHFIYNENPDLPTAIRLAVGDVYSPSQQDVEGILVDSGLSIRRISRPSSP